MNFLELAKKRFAVRKYQARQVENEKLAQILEAGRVAPTAVNFQPQRIIVVKEKTGLEKLKNAGVKIYGAPLALIVCSDHNKAWKRPIDGKTTVDTDAAIVTDHMMLQATELGLGTVWIGYFNPDQLRAEFNIPKHIEPINILAVGYSAENAAAPDRHDKARKPINEIVFYEEFSS
ncbi:nitroreductase family protein [Peptococcaceae bacterium 1198_IL3148]